MKTNYGSSPEGITELAEPILINNWQVCPKCHGQGKIWMMPGQPWLEIFTGTGKPFECDVCNGKKIISAITGKPPEL